MEHLAGKLAVVTGGASGIGRATAEAFIAEGMRVVIADVDRARVEEVAGAIGAAPVHCDVTSWENVAAMRDQVADRHGDVDVVCANAGVGGTGHLVDVTLEDWRWVIDVNLWGVVHTMHAFLPLLADRGEGHVVFTASMAGLHAYEGIGPYAATKHAVVGIADSLRLECGGTGVGVSVVCPGLVRTAIFQSHRWRATSGGASARAKARATEVAELVDRRAIEPERVATQIVRAVREDRFWVLTHPREIGPAITRIEELRVAVAHAEDPATELD